MTNYRFPTSLRWHQVNYHYGRRAPNIESMKIIVAIEDGDGFALAAVVARSIEYCLSFALG